MDVKVDAKTGAKLGAKLGANMSQEEVSDSLPYLEAAVADCCPLQDGCQDECEDA